MLDIDKTAKIGIFGHYGNKNLGDEAIIAAVVQNLRLRLPQASLVCFSDNPKDTESRYQITTYPVCRSSEKSVGEAATAVAASNSQSASITQKLKAGIKRVRPLWWALRPLSCALKAAFAASKLPVEFARELGFYRKSFRILKDIDVLMITGSNQFLDNFGGARGFPYNLLTWSVLARLAGAKLIYVSVGAGPINSTLSKILIRAALVFSEYTSFRDAPSQELIRSIGFKGPSYVYPDLAFSLMTEQEVDANTKEKKTVGSRPTVGINVMPLYSNYYWCTRDSQKYSDYIETMARFATALIEQDYPIFFWGTQIRDERTIQDLLKTLKERFGLDLDSHPFHRRSRSVHELLGIVDSADILVTTRFHGTLLTLFRKKPVLAICYYRKTDDLMHEMQQGKYSVAFETLDAEDMLSRLRFLERNMQNETRKIGRTVEAYRASLDEQYDRLFGHVSTCSALTQNATS